MGRWDGFLWSADAPLDALARVVDATFRDIERYARTKRGTRTPPRLAAAVGVLLCAAPHALDPDSDRFSVVAHALRKHDAGFDALDPEAASILRAIAAGHAKSLSPKRLDEAHPRHKTLGPLGARPCPSALFAHPLSRAYAQKVAARAARAVERELTAFDEEYFYDDGVLGPLGLLAILEGWTLPRATLDGWKKRMSDRWNKALWESGEESDTAFMKAELWPRTEALFTLIAPAS
ncbi:MAG: hypothetical protein R3A52_29550 [Polyangiales bacterium]